MPNGPVHHYYRSRRTLAKLILLATLLQIPHPVAVCPPSTELDFYAADYSIEQPLTIEGNELSITFTTKVYTMRTNLVTLVGFSAAYVR